MAGGSRPPCRNRREPTEHGWTRLTCQSAAGVHACRHAYWAMAGRQTPSLGACVLRSSGAVCRLPSETYAPDQVSSRVRQGRVHPCKTIGRATDALPRSPVYKFRRLQFLFDSSFASQPQFGSSLFRFFRGSGLQTLPIPLTVPQEQGPKPRWTMALVQRLVVTPCRALLQGHCSPQLVRCQENGHSSTGPIMPDSACFVG